MKKKQTGKNVNADSSTKKDATMTPYRAAMVLVYDWMTIGGASPWYMDAEEMSVQLSSHGYRVTDKRREEIIKHVDKLVEPFREKLADRLQNAGFSL